MTTRTDARSGSHVARPGLKLDQIAELGADVRGGWRVPEASRFRRCSLAALASRGSVAVAALVEGGLL